MKKPALIFDGDCGFCRRWVGRWRAMTEDRVEYATFQSAAGRFPQIKQKDFEGAVHLIDMDGRVWRGAAAVFRLLRIGADKRWPLRLYSRVPPFAWTCETFYGFVARHRQAFSRLTGILWGDTLDPPSYYNVRWIFLRLLGLCYFFAFGSLWLQIDGLLGINGILPAAPFIAALRQRYGAAILSALPTLLWFHPTDAALRGLCALGTLFSALLVLDLAPGPILLILWALYLSLVNVGRDFLSFQWDILLLEAGFLAVFFAPWKLRPGISRETKPPALSLALFRWLLFRLMFESGCVKVLSGDPNWRNLTALEYHYWTQPLPTWIGWWASQLPAAFQRFSAGCVFAVEIVLPFFIFLPRRPRLAAFFGFIFLQVLIGITGNYGFFNLLAGSLCVLLLDDAYLAKAMPRRFLFRAPADEKLGGRWRTRLCLPVAALAAIFGAVQIAGIFGRRPRLPRFVSSISQAIEPWHLVNGYGLFAVMTTSRHEISLEGSADGRTWLEYPFRWKPDAPGAAPRFVEPHQPRLDWQMWFAALGDCRDNPWFLNVMARLLQGSKPVASLLAANPFPDKPPRYVRAVLYDYRLTDWDERRKTGDWWTRKILGLYCPVVSLKKTGL
ncbi:MAG: lipase maturation factor family protein [Elusimicrobiota bacterium]